jgi:leucyl aminopeptidase (aminopeptidase T)
LTDRVILKRLSALEKKLQAKQESSESAARLIELLRQLEEANEELRSRSGYTVDLELEIAERAVKELVEKGLL